MNRTDVWAAAEQQPQMPPPTVDEIDVIRHREITSKAVSAIILLALKWFKVSRKSLRLAMHIASRRGGNVIGFRHHEVPSSRTASARYQLSPVDLEDVRPARSISARDI